jgi:hypothetical protein
VDARDARRALVVVVLTAALVYWGSLANGFVLDDRGIVVNNPGLRDAAVFWRAFVSPYWPPDIGAGQYRPLGIVSFAADLAVAGLSPRWFHTVNVLWHAAATGLVYALARRLMVPTGAFVAAMFFAVHPVHVEAVANVVGRLEPMAATFGLATILLHLRGSLWAPLTFAGALFSKEHALLVPLLAWLVQRGVAGPSRRVLWMAYAGVAALWGGLLLVTFREAPFTTVSAVYQDTSLGSRWLTALSVVPHYARLLLAPAWLSADYEPGVLRPVDTPTLMVFLGALILLLTVVLAWRLARAHRTVTLAIAWIVVTIAPVSNVVVLTGVALAERTLYLPSVGAALFVGAAAQHLAASQPRAVVAGGAAVVLSLLAVRTITRVPVWRDARSFAIALVTEQPLSYRGHWVAGRALRAGGNVEGAVREFRLARTIYPHDASLLREAAALEEQVGRTAQARFLRDSAAVVDERRRVSGRVLAPPPPPAASSSEGR